MTEIEKKRHDWWQNALKSSLTFIYSDTCHKCGKHRPGVSNISDMSFTCLMCRAEELFPDPPKLDLADFARL